jgi:hypothetical protein
MDIGHAEKAHPPEIPRPEDQQVLAPEAQQILAEDNSPMDVTTMDNVPSNAPKTKDVGELHTKSTNDGDASNNHDNGEVYEKQDKGEAVQTDEKADKTPDEKEASSVEYSSDTDDEKHAPKAAKPTARTAKMEESLSDEVTMMRRSSMLPRLHQQSLRPR